MPALSGRWTALHYAAYHGFVSAGAELLVGGADQRITDIRG
jgi:ankyrin repeat protein